MIGLHVEVPQKPELPLMGSSQIAEVKSSLQPLVESLDEEVSFPQGDGLWTQQFALELLPFRNSFSSETEYSHWLPLDREVPGVDGAGPAQRLDSMPIKPDPPGTTTPGRFSAVREDEPHPGSPNGRTHQDYLAYLDTARHFIEQEQESFKHLVAKRRAADAAADANAAGGKPGLFSNMKSKLGW
ncbi:unnamed protein product [Durusdinium trenchii]|uniref:Uncharacterized protein n=1 Tax=Durusdinium trenchii TaxID=1381693 RepID=A0ABP0QW85_9DINO